jgi:hypothetical protein
MRLASEERSSERVSATNRARGKEISGVEGGLVIAGRC